MAKRRAVSDPKAEHLRAEKALNARSDRVRDPAFLEHEFFDPRDLVQVKYELLRRVRLEGRSVTESVAAFGFSRPAFYEAKAALERGGLPGLLPRKRGPRSGHKLTDDVIAFVQEMRARDAALRPAELAMLVLERFGISVHPRSIERALARQGKKRR
ncbi:MAG: helix-turn-helix domain-containing protein [Planctomycetes bacterium]|nr:helix-turn-helix domain-containing protein [Planctomycetota bacterium]